MWQPRVLDRHSDAVTQGCTPPFSPHGSCKPTDEWPYCTKEALQLGDKANVLAANMATSLVASCWLTPKVGGHIAVLTVVNTSKSKMLLSLHLGWPEGVWQKQGMVSILSSEICSECSEIVASLTLTMYSLKMICGLLDWNMNTTGLCLSHIGSLAGPRAIQFSTMQSCLHRKICLLVSTDCGACSTVLFVSLQRCKNGVVFSSHYMWEITKHFAPPLLSSLLLPLPSPPSPPLTLSGHLC